MSKLDKTLNEIISRHEKRVGEFKAQVEALDKYEATKPIKKLLECDRMLVYSLFGVGQNYLEGMSILFNTLSHAFLDDGELSISRRECAHHRDMHKVLSEAKGEVGEPIGEYKPYYYYSIVNGCADGAKPLSPEEFSMIVDMKQKSYDHYADNADLIEGDIFGEEATHNRKLSEEARMFMEKLYAENNYSELGQ